MGVPSFYRWLVSRYPKVVCQAIEEAGDVVDITLPNPNGVEFDNLYLDMNGIIHPCFHPEDNVEAPTTYEEVFSRIFRYIDRLFCIVRPRKLLYLAIDGVAPRAKMNQQRSRRFRSAKDRNLAEVEEDRLRIEFESQGKMVLPKVKCEVDDSNVITPGTDFLYKVAEALQGFIFSRMSTNESWKNIKVILSDANVPGEGEHKIMSFIRQQRSDSNYNPNTRHCLYGLDADLIMLALTTHEPHFTLLREDVLMEDKQSHNVKKPFEFLHIWLLREYLEFDLRIDDLPNNMEVDFERIVDDFVFMCFFAGNDFLPHIPTLDIREGAIDLMMDVYKRQFKARGGYLIDMTKVKDKHNGFVKLKRVENFIISLGSYEDAIFNKRSELRERKIKQFLRYHSEVVEPEDESRNAAQTAGFSEENQIPLEFSTQTEVINNTNDLQCKLKELMKKKSDIFSSGNFGTDKIQLGKAGWKRRYYAEKFAAASNEEFEHTRAKIILNYVEGLVWVLLYYYNGVPSWTWFYPFHYGPFASDFVGMSKIKVKFTKGSPFKPLDQLMAVLPPRSADALPQPYKNLMTDKDSSIADFYPEDFDIDVDGKRFLWQGISKLSFIDERRLLSETRELEKELDVNEAKRNEVGNDKIFVSAESQFGESLLEATCQLKSRKSELNTRLSDGLCGIIKPLQLPSQSTSRENNIICVYFEEHADMMAPCFRPLDGVTFPDKTITESDIVETKLWHTCRLSRPPNTNTRGGRGFGRSNNSATWTANRGRGRGRGNESCTTFSEKVFTSKGFSQGRGRPGNTYWPSVNSQEQTGGASRRW